MKAEKQQNRGELQQELQRHETEIRSLHEKENGIRGQQQRSHPGCEPAGNVIQQREKKPETCGSRQHSGNAKRNRTRFPQEQVWIVDPGFQRAQIAYEHHRHFESSQFPGIDNLAAIVNSVGQQGFVGLDPKAMCEGEA
ncbi:MAG TPA: hypothetical protein VKV17_05930 [Bryobacteraceae bacterium]|nr:hypothetical protein [Bryobacteraceae bacterium]